jgi:hypothetical protein
MQTIFNQFKEKFDDKSLNEILGCAKYHCENLILIKDVDEYDNNEFAFVVQWYTEDGRHTIDVECRFSHLTGDSEYILIPKEVKKFGRTWEIVQNLDLKITENGYPIWWEVLKMDDGVLWMNNCDGCMAFIENNGRVLKTYF